MYLLYYIAANEYPFRPVVAYTVNRDSIVTMNWSFALIGKGVLAMLLLFALMIWFYNLFLNLFKFYLFTNLN